MNDAPAMRQFVNLVGSGADLTPELDDTQGETLDYRLKGVGLAFGNDEDNFVGTGELLITNKRILWIGQVDEGAEGAQENRKCFDFDVPYIILHAISRDPESYPVPCLYCQLDREEDVGTESEGKEGEDEYDTGEVFFIPPKDGDDQLQAMFDAFSHAALLNPDPLSEDEGDGEEYEGSGITIIGDNENSAGFIFNGEEVRLGVSQAATLAHLESVFIDPSQQHAREEAREGEEEEK